MKIEIGNGWMTVSKIPVRIVCIDGPGEYPVVGYMGTEQFPRVWTQNGIHNIVLPYLDLNIIEKHVTKEITVYVYRHIKDGHIFIREREAFKHDNRMLFVKSFTHTVKL